MRVLLAVLIATAAPAVDHRPADVAAARASLLTARDLGKGWTGKAVPRTGVQLRCKGWSPSGSGIVETGAATSQNLTFGTTGPFVSQQTSVFASAAQADTYWRRAVRAGLLTCAVQNVQLLRAKGVELTILSKQKVALASGLVHSAELRIRARANRLTLYFDVLLLGNGRTITSIVLSSFQQAPTAAVEQGLARLVVRRLGGPAA